MSPSSGDGQYLKGTQHGFCPQTQNTTGRRSVHLKGTQHRFWVLRIFAHKHDLGHVWRQKILSTQHAFEYFFGYANVFPPLFRDGSRCIPGNRNFAYPQTAYPLPAKLEYCLPHTNLINTRSNQYHHHHHQHQHQ